jgi:hypothetical protein
MQRGLQEPDGWQRATPAPACWLHAIPEQACWRHAIPEPDEARDEILRASPVPDGFQREFQVSSPERLRASFPEQDEIRV